MNSSFFYNNDSGISGSSKNARIHPVVETAATNAPTRAATLTNKFILYPPFFYTLCNWNI